MKRNRVTIVASYTLEGKLVRTYKSAKEASKRIGVFSRTIDRCIRGDITTVKGKRWKRFLVDEVPTSIPPLEKTSISLSIKPVAKIDENGNILEVYPSLRNASIKNNIDAHTLRDRLNNKYKNDGKAKFRYLTDNEISKYGYKNGKEIDNSKKAIVQYSLTKEYIKTYPSIRAALLALNKSTKNQGINKCLSGQYKTAFGYIWKYKSKKTK